MNWHGVFGAVAVWLLSTLLEKKKRSFPRRVLRLFRFLISIQILIAGFSGKMPIVWAALSFAGIWIVYVIVDALMVYNDPKEYSKYTYPLNQLPRARR